MLAPGRHTGHYDPHEVAGRFGVTVGVGDAVGVPPVFVVVSGPPGSGKSTLAAPLAQHLRLPLIAKDTIKEALMTALGAPDVETSQRLGAAAIQVILGVAAASPIGAVIESNLRRSMAVGELNRLPGVIVEIFCRCNPAVAHARYVSRTGTRHAGHFDELHSDREHWRGEGTEPVAGGWPLLEVDTNQTVDLSMVVAYVRQQIGEGKPRERA